MAWRGTFKSRLRGVGAEGQPRTDVRFVIRSRPTFNGKRWMPYFVSSEAMDPMLITSHPVHLITGLVGDDPLLSEVNPHSLVSYKETSSSVAIRTWSPKFSSFTFEMADDIDTTSHMKRIPKGMIVEVFAGFDDYHFDEYQRINLGVVRQIRRERGRFVVQCDEIFTVMTSPSAYDSASFPHVPMSFDGAGDTFETAEVVSQYETKIDITSGDDGLMKFAGDMRSGRDRMVVELPDNDEPTGKNVYLRLDVSGSLTSKLDRAPLSSTDGSGTTYYPNDWFDQDIGLSASLPPGSTVIDYKATGRVYYTPNAMGIADSFLDCFTRILTSTGKYGTGDQNGSFDTLDKVLGFGFPHELFDRGDSKAWHKRFSARDLEGFIWTPFFGSESENGWSVIQGALKNFGIWITMKEGDYTLRSAVSHTDDLEGAVNEGVVYTDDIIKIKKHEWFHPSCRVEHGGMSYAGVGYIYDPDSATENEVDTRPFAGKIIKSTINGPVMFSGPQSPDATTCWEFGSTNPDHDASLFAVAQSGWFTRIPELLEIEVNGLGLAHLCPGSIIDVDCPLVHGPEGEWSYRTAMVQSIQRDWMRGRVTLTLAALPTVPQRYR